MVNNQQNRFIFTIPFYLKEDLMKMSKEKGCSQAEIVKIALIKYFNGFEK
jgi:hypothetical protein